jgi:hypothetical protein
MRAIIEAKGSDVVWAPIVSENEPKWVIYSPCGTFFTIEWAADGSFLKTA